MDQRYFAIGILVIFMLVLVYMHWEPTVEGFSSKREKAEALFGWFNANPSPTYSNYKRDLNLASNIVEYEDIMKLFGTHNLTVDSVEKVL